MPEHDELITAALRDRANSVTASALRYPDFAVDRIEDPRPVRRRFAGRASVLAAASAMAVLAIAIGVSLARPDGHHSTSTAGGDLSAVLVGTQWHLSDVRTANRSYTIPADYRAELSFTAGGRVSGLDGLNTLAGTYRVSANKITIRITETGTAGGTATFPAQQAMASVYASPSRNSDSVTSTYTHTPDTLTLDTGHWVLTFSADGPEQSAPATSTPETSSPVGSPSIGKPAPRGKEVLGLVRSATKTAAGYRVVLAPATRQPNGQFVAIPGRDTATYLVPTTMVPDGGVTLTGPIQVTVDRGHVTALTIVGG